jgi:Ca2+-binding EF-hand superfamily protein
MDEEVIDGKTHTWVGAFVYSHEKDENVFIGALRFKAEDLVLSKRVASFVEVYGRRIPVAEIPKVTVTFGNLKINGKAADVKAVQAIYPKGVPDYADAKLKDGWVIIEVGEPIESRTDRRVELAPAEDDIGSQAGQPSQPSQLGDKTPLQILDMLGAKGEAGAKPAKLAEYRRIFGFLDANDDGELSAKEFIEDGRYMTREARQGIFRASDANGDGVVSEEEYVTNRIITDEAKAIMAKMDKDGDGKVTREEFIGGSGLPEELSKPVFDAFDTDGTDELVIPEYLRVWGRWARSGDDDR